jgi:3-hydroxyacyl-CoA dehydrogenase
MLDMAGIDVGAKVVLEQKKIGALPPDPSYRAVVLKMFELGRFGQKTKQGYYRYEGRAATHDDAVMQICADLARRHDVRRRTDVTDEEIVERCLYPLVNEGARILEEGISYRPGDIDVVWTSGFGFPDFRGGPMHMADAIGLPVIAARMDHYARSRGNRYGYWTKAPLLERLAAEGKGFADWTRAATETTPRREQV